MRRSVFWVEIIVLLVLFVLGVLALISFWLLRGRTPEKVTVMNEEVQIDKTSNAILSTNTKFEEMTFLVDAGIRMDQASNPGVRSTSNGTIELLYRDSQTGVPYVVSSDDGLTFQSAKVLTQKEADLFRAKQLADGTWAGYDYDIAKGDTCLTRHWSSDGQAYIYEDTCSYTFTLSDNGLIGVYDFFVDEKQNVVLLYTGDRQWPGNEDGLNNLRRAYSVDNGKTFTFTNGNVLGDEQLGGGENSYVDPNLTILEDGSVLLVAMKQGVIYGFLSENAGVSFQRIEEPLLEGDDFISLGRAVGMTDPQVLLLPNGNIRLYAHLLLDEGLQGPSSDDREVIVSATAIFE